MKLLGLDIGTNSVGSAWVDTEAKTITMGVSVFPAGVEESEDKRGAPKNQARRGKRSLRRSIHRRAQRKRRLRELLTEVGLLPRDSEALRRIFGPRKKGEEFDLQKWDPWNLRRKGLFEELTPYEFGRVLIHLNQRRGALGIHREGDDEGEVRKAISHLQLEMLQRYADPETAERLHVNRRLEEVNTKGKRRKKRGSETENDDEWKKEFAEWLQQKPVTVGRMMADARDTVSVFFLNRKDKKGEHRSYQGQPIRNRRGSFQFHAERALIRDEFRKLWEKQQSSGGELSRLLADHHQLSKQLDDPERELYGETGKQSWRHGGALFGQRKTYWRGPGRCELEPTDRCVPEADMYGQEFRVLDYVNNLRIQEGRISRPLKSDGERGQVLDLLRKGLLVNEKGKATVVEDIGVETLKKALRIDKRSLAKRGIPEGYCKLSVATADEQHDDDEPKPVVDWFYRRIVCSLFEKDSWSEMDDRNKDSLNRAILTFDPDDEADEKRIRKGAPLWWGLRPEQTDQMITIWKERPKLERRLNLSRKAIRRLLPIMQCPRQGQSEEYPNQIQARKILAEDLTNGLTVEERARYAPKVTQELKESLTRQYGEDAVRKAMRQRGINKKARHYLKKHVGILLPPAPQVSNPVVRKALHEVRGHILAHLDAHRTEDGTITLPHRVVVELAREGRQSAKVRDAIHSRNRARRQIRGDIVKQHGLDGLTRNQRERAIERVLLCRQQNFICPYTSLSVDDPKKQATVEGSTCPYSGKSITEDQAVQGIDVEIDHIVPYSRCGDNSINNKVLCYREANKDKGNQTPSQWLGKNSPGFEAVEQRMRHLDIAGRKGSGPPKDDYFTKKDYKRKWDNLHRVPAPDEFRNSQLSDAAYAAKQVGDYLRSALFNGESDGKQRVFFSNGKLTARLRDDWMLYPESRETINTDDPQAREKDERNWAKRVKDRSDHRHHAIDAVVIALTPDYVHEIAQEENYRETYYHRTGYRPRRNHVEIPEPWVSLADFRHGVLSRLFASFDNWDETAKGGKGEGIDLIVSHRAEKRHLVGGLHNDMPHGATEEPGVYARRKRIKDLLPKKSTDSASWVEYIRDKSIRNIIKKNLAREDIEVVETKPKTGRPSIKFMDKATGKPPNIEKIRKALSNLRMRSGVPIHTVRIQIPIGAPVHPVSNDGVERFYESDNNHHVEILRDKKTGKWTADPPVRMYDAAMRNRDRLRALKRAGVPTARRMRKLKEDKSDREQYRAVRERHRQIIAEIERAYPIVNRSDRDGKEFVMSLSIGEMLHMRHKHTKESGYFVVFELKQAKIGFMSHCDARRAEGKGAEKRDEFYLSASQLKDYGPNKDTPPCKVRVDPLGNVRRVPKD